MRRLDAEEIIALERLSLLIAELRADVLERLANSSDVGSDTFLKGKAQAYADLMQLPALQQALDEAERRARVNGEDHVGHRPEVPAGIWQRLRERYGVGTARD